ncbi:MAG: carboxypeptidase regulatory-like domain-containing protein [Pyrinomonadaceae bacterium]
MHVSFLRAVSVCILTLAMILFASIPVSAQTEGTFDLSFNSAGYRYQDYGGALDEAMAVAVQPDGKIISAGYAEGISGTGTDFALARYNADGSVDVSFGAGGRVTTAIGPGSNADVAYAVAIQTDGKIVAAGQADGIGGSGTDFAVVRYNADGSLDLSFGVGGKVTTPIGPGSVTDIANALAIQTDGTIVAAGYVDDMGSSGSDYAVVKYSTDGSLEPLFGIGGKVTTPIGADAVGDFARAVVIQPDGKIVAAGYTEDASGDSIGFSVVRYNSDGTLDSSFEGDGKVISTIGSSTTFDIATAVAMQSDGKIVAVGFTEDEFLGADFAVVRYNADGTPDATFDTDGIATTAIGPGANFDIGQAVVIQPDGKIIAAGFTDDFGGGLGTDLALVRYNANGSLDNAFNTDGKATIDLGGTEFIRGVAIYSGNRIAVAGGGGSDFLTARIWLTTLTTAADVTISGRVTDETGRAIRGAVLTLADEKGVTRAVLSNTFGYYRFTRVGSENTYVLRADARRYAFADPVRIIDARSDLSSVDFVAQTLRSVPVLKGKFTSEVK